jgi:hypothetical protein
VLLFSFSLFFSLFFSFFSQQAEDRASIIIKPSDFLNPSPWKASLCHTKCHFSLTAGSKPAYMKLQKIQVSSTHHRKIIQRSPRVYQTTPPIQAKLKAINREL